MLLSSPFPVSIPLHLLGSALTHPVGFLKQPYCFFPHHGVTWWPGTRGLLGVGSQPTGVPPVPPFPPLHPRGVSAPSRTSIFTRDLSCKTCRGEHGNMQRVNHSGPTGLKINPSGAEERQMPPAQPRDFGSTPRKRPSQTRGTHGCCLHPALGARPGARFAHKQGRQQRRVEKNQ